MHHILYVVQWIFWCSLDVIANIFKIVFKKKKNDPLEASEPMQPRWNISSTGCGWCAAPCRAATETTASTAAPVDTRHMWSDRAFRRGDAGIFGKITFSNVVTLANWMFDSSTLSIFWFGKNIIKISVRHEECHKLPNTVGHITIYYIAWLIFRSSIALTGSFFGHLLTIASRQSLLQHWIGYTKSMLLH